MKKLMKGEGLGNSSYSNYSNPRRDFEVFINFIDDVTLCYHTMCDASQDSNLFRLV
jgi:hypothetical protein